MEMLIHLHPDVFDIVKNGSKKVEVRIYDEKRRKLKVGDTLIFLKRPEETETITATVTKLDIYKNFKELVKHYDIKDLYLESYTKEMFLEELKRFYTEEEQEENGVVAISFEKK
ncbi:MAG: ASCH domain-containing protein [Bacilli bacterium]|nr:ASCH domain-containing protein [Bacilli bacterium]